MAVKKKCLCKTASGKIPCRCQIKLSGDNSYHTPQWNRKGMGHPRKKGGNKPTPTDLWNTIPQSVRNTIKQELIRELGKAGLAVGTVVAGVAGKKLYKHVKGKK